ncbi:hypothetical protein NE237_013136 [Protea cynaroides]|uniref:Uncharacterized protein n=1 Tax=Protea cynaroides TaxID=273540 RepID=A0A9Q0GYR4_9MAGN|nr:hypothetical protein NE237_013136 [Protea cynaroides]
MSSKANEDVAGLNLHSLYSESMMMMKLLTNQFTFVTISLSEPESQSNLNVIPPAAHRYYGGFALSSSCSLTPFVFPPHRRRVASSDQSYFVFTASSHQP